MLKQLTRSILIVLLLCQAGAADTHVWEPKAADTHDIRTFTFANTWAGDDTVTVDVAGTDLAELTLGSTSATSAETVADAVYDMLRSVGATDNVNSDETRTIGGQSDPRIAEWEFEIDGAVVTARSVTAGKPHDIGMTADTAGDGDVSESVVQNATGKHFFSNADNWNPAGPPVSGDTLQYRYSDVDCKYGFPVENFEPAAVACYASYTGEIGLPVVNADNSGATYPEWRATEMLLEEDTVDEPFIRIGRGRGPGSSRLRFLCDGVVTEWIIHQTGSASSSTESAVTLKQINGAMDASSFNIFSGNVEVSGFTAITDITVGIPGGANAATNVIFESCQGVGGGLTTKINSGVVDYECFFNMTSTFTLNGGEVVLKTFQDGVTVNGGTLVCSSSDNVRTIVSLTISDEGTVDFGGETEGWTITDTEIYSGSTLLDPNGLNTWTNGIDLINCKMTEVTLDVFGKHTTITPSAP